MSKFIHRELSIFLSFVFLFSAFIYAQSEQNYVLNSKTRNYDQKHVKLDLSFSFDKSEVFGKEEFTFSPLENNFQKLVLHSRTTQVSKVFFDGKELNFSQTDNLLFINFDDVLNAGKDATVTIEYSSLPEAGLYFFKPTKEYPEIPYQIWSQGEGRDNRYWYPAYDEPDDKLTSEIIATVPDNLIAISNGKLKSVTLNSKSKTKTFDWEMDQPYSNYLTTLIVGDFVTIKEKLRGTTLDYNVPRKWADQYDSFYGRTPQMLNFYSDYIYPYPYSRYAQTAVQDFLYGGMENVTATTLNQRIYHDKTAEPNYSPDGLIAHEFAHQWFGDFLTCKTWDHIWLNEGFATYFTDLWTENEFGENEFRYLRFQENNAYFDEVNKQPLDKIKKDSTGVVPVELGGGKAYDRGAAVLNTLRYYLGNEAFEKGIKHYVNKFKHSAVVTEDFRKAMEEATGKNLKEFFNQWIYGAGFPVYDVSYTWDEVHNKLLLKVKQVQKQLPAVGLFTAPVLVEITSGKKVIQKKITISKEEEVFAFDCNEKPQMIRFNKYMWTLCSVHFRKNFDELVYQLQYDDDVVGRIFAAKVLPQFGDTAVSYLARSIKRDNFYGVRQAVVEGLRKIGGDKVLDPLLIASDDPDARVREEAVKSLSIFPASKVDKFLVDKFKSDNNVYVKGAAAYSIGAVKMKGAFEFLVKALKMDSHRNIIRRDVFDGLKKLGDPRAIKLAGEYSQYKYSYGGMHLLDITALDCAMEFSVSHRNEVINVLAKALKNPYFRTRNYAAGSLAKLGATSKLSLLQEILKSERRNRVTRSLNSAIKRLEGK